LDIKTDLLLGPPYFGPKHLIHFTPEATMFIKKFSHNIRLLILHIYAELTK